MAATFNLKYSYDAFARDVISGFRYTWNEETANFLDAVCGNVKIRLRQMEQGKVLFRTQRGCSVALQAGSDDEKLKFSEDSTGYLRNAWLPANDSFWKFKPYGRDRMIPHKEKAKEGRANPKGIPCLYLATDRNTVLLQIAEGRQAAA